MNKYHLTVMSILENHSGYTEAEILGGGAGAAGIVRVKQKNIPRIFARLKKTAYFCARIEHVFFMVLD